MIKIFLLFSWLIFHPVHISMSSIDYSGESDSFKVFLKMYYDDFLLDAKQNITESGLSGDENLLRETVKKYLDSNFLIFINQKQLHGSIEELKLINGEIIVNLNFNTAKPRGSITVKNLIMTNLYPDQANMMIIKINDFEQGFKLTSEKTEQSFKIN